MAHAERALTDDELIERYIEPNPDPRRQYDAHTTEGGAPLYAIIGLLRVVEGDVGKVAEAYDLPIEAVCAAIAYYCRHKADIDAFLVANAQ